MNEIRVIRRAVGMAVMLAAGLAPTFAANAAAADAAGTAADNDTLQEVVVTAERRSENLQRVAIAATVLSGDELESRAVGRINDLQDIAPGLSITNTGLVESVNIRGIGIASGSPAVANGVATYIDGVFQPPIVALNQFFDLANIQVFRGPQGTLVGSNSTGGAIFITSQNPSFDHVKGYGELNFGNDGAHGAQGAINLPAGDTLAFRLAGDYQKQNSQYTSVGPVPTDAGMLDDKEGRIGMLWKPGAFQLLAKLEMADRQTGGYAYQPISGTAYGAGAQANPFNLNYDSPTENHERGTIGTVEMKYEFSGGTTFRSLSGYQDKNIHNLYDLDGTTLPPPGTSDQYVREREWTQEFNLISSTQGNSNWIVGSYLQRNIIGVKIHQTVGGFPTDIFSPEWKTTTGLFGQYNYKFSPEWELQSGLRYSTYLVAQGGNVRIGNGIPVFPPGGLQVANLSSDHHDGRPTGKVNLQYTPDADNTYYAFIARGYKAGGANSSISQFDPETVWDYEAGWKSSFAGGHIHTQVGAYYNSYQNFQFGVLNTGTTQNNVENLATATIYGAEGQIQFQSGGWHGDAGIAYVHSKLPGIPSGFVNTRLAPSTNLPQCGIPGAPATPPGCLDYAPYTVTVGSGPNLFSPEWTYNIGIEYKIHLDGDFTLTPHANLSYVGSQWGNLAYSYQTDYLPGYTLYSAELTLGMPNQWSLQAYGTNLADKIYIAGQGGGENENFYGQRRMFGVRVHKNF